MWLTLHLVLLAGFLIFAWLTLNALLAEPAPLALAEPKLKQLEASLQQQDCSLGALWQAGRPQFDFGWDPVAPSKCLEDQLSQQYGNSSSQIDQLIRSAQADGISSRSVGQAVADQLGLAWPTPRWPALVFLGGAMACMLTSTVAHLFGCCSEHLGKLMWRLDYSGITILIVTSFFPPVYYGFMCQPFWRNVYLGITSVVGDSFHCEPPCLDLPLICLSLKVLLLSFFTQGHILAQACLCLNCDCRFV